jgi:hypothetical protein
MTRLGAAYVYDASLTLTYLASYAGMGMAALSCVAGCTCAEAHLDAHHVGRHTLTSLWTPTTVRMGLSPRATACTLALRVLNTTRSEGKIQTVGAHTRVESTTPCS